MTKIIAIANQKGGVGKTTTAATLGSILAAKGYNTLLVDLDAQANLTQSFVKQEVEDSFYYAMKYFGKRKIHAYAINKHLALVPSSIEMASIELELAARMSREMVIKDLLTPLCGGFDYIILDCSPQLGLLAINAFTFAQKIIIPLTAEALPYRGLDMISKTVDMVRKHLNPSLEIGGIVITRWNGRKLNKAVEESVRGRYGDLVFKTKIHENISLAEAPIAYRSILEYAPKSRGTADYIELADEIIERFG